MHGLVMPKLSCPKVFDLRLALHGHGWVSLAPHRWHEERRRLETVLQVGERAIDVELFSSPAGLRFEISDARASTVTEVRAQLSRMLRLDEDFAPFWQACKREPRLRWVAKRGAGRLMRSPTTFEDLMKLLFTTNCSWAATKLMTSRLVEALGAPAPSGRRAFPGPRICLEAGPRFFRDEVRAGYRASRAVELAAAFVEDRISDGQLDDPSVSTDVLRARLLALPGFGPYAAGQALRLFGRYDDLALDSWCRSKLAELEGRKKPRSDRAIEKSYERYGSYRGLVLWMDLTADWHRTAKRRMSPALSRSASQE